VIAEPYSSAPAHSDTNSSGLVIDFVSDALWEEWRCDRFKSRDFSKWYDCKQDCRSDYLPMGVKVTWRCYPRERQPVNGTQSLSWKLATWAKQIKLDLTLSSLTDRCRKAIRGHRILPEISC